jgi:glycosyltransferase 2 family protein
MAGWRGQDNGGARIVSGSKSRPLWRSVLAYGIKLTIGALLLWFVARRVPLDEAFAALATVSPWLWVLAIVIFGIVLALGAWRWHLTSLRSIPVRTCFAYAWIGHFYATVLPGAVVGDVAKAAALATSDAKHRNMVLPVSVFLDRLLGLISLLLVLVVALAAMGGEKRGLHPALLAMGTGLIVAVLVLTPQIISAALSLSRKLHFLPHAVIHGLDRIHFVIRQVGVKLWILMLMLSLLMHALGGFIFVAAAREFAISIEASGLALYYVAISVVVMLPVTIAGIGAREQVSVWILGGSAGAVTMPVALSWFLLVSSAVHAVIGGLLQLGSWLRSARKVP